MTDASFFTEQQLRFFSDDLLQAFVRAGFEIVDEPHIDHALCGFRATYVRRYVFQKPSIISDGILTTFIHVVGLPFGRRNNKMVVLSTSKDAADDTIETVKLRVHFDDQGLCQIIHGDKTSSANHESGVFEVAPDGSDKQAQNQSNQKPLHHELRASFGRNAIYDRIHYDLAIYVARIIEIISPGLIELPIEMKLEILKKLSVDSIIKMSQVNNEFRAIIFEHGETLWRHLCFRDFNIRSINRFMHRSWMELYRDSYILQQVEICRKERALPGLPERPALPPVPNRLQIEWWPAVIGLPFYPLHDLADAVEDRLQLALEMPQLRRADSLDSLNH